MKKILKWGVIILIGIIVISALGGDKNSTPISTNTGTTSESPKPEEKKAEAKTYGLNEEVRDKDLAFTVTSVTKKQTLGNAYTKKTAQGIYYVVTIKISNKGDSTATFDSSMAKMTDSQSRQFDHSTDGQIALGLAQGKVDLFLQQVQPGLSYTGDLVFDVPADISNPQLVVKGSFFSSGAKIKLE